MQNTPLFIGLTREVTFAGLPIMYLVVLVSATILGFIISQSFLYLVLMGGFGYAALRGLAAYDPKIINVFIATVQQTRMHPGLFTGEGVVYRA
ncbi:MULTISPECIES: VirB3 family type IV secretion system protein [Rhizobium/Agrobacterium group]|jgi:type IV secretion system protein VirB3|uniref:Transmembrane protein n=2 Tax=Rhizobium/Agrobacterium group TaxID=227290 RepID=A0ABR5CM36_9HYPH|nr:VirB3 family type IV secretion system protein [Rhizobium nepotum]KJF65647.1 transmembrane protein [Rhizobium nepotum 39/7]KJF70935.1 transmembrane protein [Agrobacterium arsenijevicii]